MRQLVIVCLLAFPLAWAANPDAVVTSAEPIRGALESLPNATSVFTPNYLPGYGYQANGTVLPRDDVNAQSVANTVSNILLGLAGTVQGLEDGDWISISFRVSLSYATVRIKPSQPETLEIWIDGEKH